MMGLEIGGRARGAPVVGRLRTLAATGVLSGLAVGLLIEAGIVLAGRNFHVVVPGRVYRSAQLSPEDLTAVVQAHGIRTVVNLRGCAAPWPWYLDEARVTAALDINQEDICLSPCRLPPVSELRRLVEVLDRTEYPVLLHCRRGADRTGLASAIALLLETGASYGAGRWQLGPRFGHVALGPTSALDDFFARYRTWLRQQGREHSRAAFRTWLARGYCPGGRQARIEPLEAPSAVRCGEPVAFRVRCRNEGDETWHFHEDLNAGVHAGFALFGADDLPIATGHAGLFDAFVGPGEAIELKLVVPPLRAPGRYRLLVDMLDERQDWFFAFGSEPMERELEAHE